MAKQGTETVTVRAKPSRNGDGDPTPGANRGTDNNAVIWPRTTDETSDRGTRIIDGLNIFIPAPVPFDILATDEIVARGKTWQVDGAAGDYRKKNGIKVGFIVAVTRAGV
jgi:hypothetical protein